MNIVQYLTELGFQRQDITLLYLAPLCAALGGFSRWVLMYKEDFRKLPSKGRFHQPMQFFAMGEWALGHAFVSGVLGLILALYFVGAFTESPTTVARVLAFSILIGFGAPRLWRTQETIVREAVDEKLKQLLKKSDEKEKSD